MGMRVKQSDLEKGRAGAAAKAAEAAATMTERESALTKALDALDSTKVTLAHMTMCSIHLQCRLTCSQSS